MPLFTRIVDVGEGDDDDDDALERNRGFSYSKLTRDRLDLFLLVVVRLLLEFLPFIGGESTRKTK